MSDKQSSPSAHRARVLLDELWDEVLKEPEPLNPNARISSLINSSYVSIRFCLPTQLLGKLTDPGLDCLCLQKQLGIPPGTWDPRGFCTKTIVPWVSENQSVLGTSTDPYVSKPLRKLRLESNPRNVKGVKQWMLLFQVLNEVQVKNDIDYTRHVFLETLRCTKLRLTEFSFEYVVPERVSLKQTLQLINGFLSESSGGDRGVSVAAALFETLAKYFQLYSSVKRFVVNAADAATGTSADIECRAQDGSIRLAVEVKERSLTLLDIRGSINKVRRLSVRELLFNAPKVKSDESAEIEKTIDRIWASGTNLYHLDIDELCRVSLTLAGEKARAYFLRKIGEQLDCYNTQPANRKRWQELLGDL